MIFLLTWTLTALLADLHFCDILLEYTKFILLSKFIVSSKLIIEKLMFRIHLFSQP